MNLYPLKFEPIYKPKVWGGRRIETLGRTLPGGADDLIGESWELADLDADQTGGEAAHSVVTNGPLAGKTLRSVVEQFGDAMLGRLQLTERGAFPLLVKYLDARENLSVQVHPSVEYARAHDEAHLKHEAWVVLHCDESAAGGQPVIYKGVRDGVIENDLRAAIESGDESAVLDKLIAVPVKPGQCHYLPSGTCHALGAGVMVAEVQTPSDTTFRVYDWGRTDRALHVEQAMRCIQFGPPNVAEHEKRTHVAGMFTTVTRLCLCDAFRIEKVRMVEGYEQEIPYDQPAVWMVLEGAGVVEPGNGAPDVPFERGETLLIPANMDNGKVKLSADTVWLEVTFPQALAEPIA